MDFNTYQRLAQRTSTETMPSAKIENGILGLAGESGECADIWKKVMFQGHEMERAKLAEELGDVLWYIAEVASGLNLSLEDIAMGNIAKLKKRYPDGFDPDRSINREKYE